MPVTMSLWRLNGGSKIIVGTTGKPIVCSSCPCCDDDLRDAIRERQHASKLSAWSAWSATYPHDTGRLIATCAQHPYTQSQLNAYVNAIAGWYLDGAWSGGSTTDLTKLTSSYANAATTEAELYALVCDMLVTVDLYGQKIGRNGRLYYGWRNNENLATAKAGADTPGTAPGPGWYLSQSAAWGAGTINANSLIEVDNSTPPFYRCSKGRQCVQFGEDGMWTGVAKTVKVYCKFRHDDVADAYEAFGEVLPAEEVWGLVYSSGDLGLASSYTAADFWPSINPPNAWPSTPAPGGRWNIGYGWPNSTYRHELIEWDFTHV